MKTKLLTGVVLCGGLLVSSGASAVLTCDNYATLSALQVAGSCLDADQDLLLTFNSTTLPLNTQFALHELEPGNAEFYDLQLIFPGGLVLTSSASFDYSLTTTNGDFLDAANFDTNIVGGGVTATKQIFDPGSATPFLTLTSSNGSHDPSDGGETPFANRTTIHVIDTLGPGPAIYNSTSNSYETTGLLQEVPEPATIGLLGLGLVALGLGRRRTS